MLTCFPSAQEHPNKVISATYITGQYSKMDEKFWRKLKEARNTNRCFAIVHTIYFLARGEKKQTCITNLYCVADLKLILQSYFSFFCCEFLYLPISLKRLLYALYRRKMIASLYVTNDRVGCCNFRIGCYNSRIVPISAKSLVTLSKRQGNPSNVEYQQTGKFVWKGT